MYDIYIYIKVYVEIVEQIRELIKEGKLKPSDKLPTEQALTKKFGTSRPSVREALSALEILGMTERRAGKGNFIKGSSLINHKISSVKDHF